MPATNEQFNATMDRSAKRRMALILAREKLGLYREQHNGEYVGGMEYTALMKLIDEAIG